MTKASRLTKVTLYALPFTLIYGWINHLFWMIGFGNRYTPILFLAGLVFTTMWYLFSESWKKADVRWMLVPIAWVITVILLPWRTFTSSPHNDVHYHILQAKNIAGISDAVPPHQGLDFLFRPPMIPGVYAGEISITGSDWIHLTHLILTIFAIWQGQHLAERGTTKPRAAIAALIFLLLPVTRYWGQFQLLDLPVAGMFLFVTHALFVAERKRKVYWFLGLLGFLAGILFLTKYVFIYTIGLAGWFILKDKNLFRAKWFTIGFSISVIPYLAYHWLLYGEPFEALTPQSSYAMKSMVSTIGTYDAGTWAYHFRSQIFEIGILAILAGFILMYGTKRDELKTASVLFIPFIIIHGIILDFGTLRYLLPVFALGMTFMVASMPDFKNKLTQDWESVRRFMNNISLVIIIAIASIHFSTLDEEYQLMEAEVPPKDISMNFYLNASEMFPENEWVISSKHIPLTLFTEKKIDSFIGMEGNISMGMQDKNINFAMTSNLDPYYAWESDFRTSFGDPNLEPVDYHQEQEHLAVLWQLKEDNWRQPSTQISSTNGSIFGNLLILNQSQSVEFSNVQNIFWVSNHSETMVQEYLNRNAESAAQTCDFSEISGFCEVENSKLTNQYAHEIYIWFV